VEDAIVVVVSAEAVVEVAVVEVAVVVEDF
jgi:hypothetical protein